jgi:hypothetical protein
VPGYEPRLKLLVDEIPYWSDMLHINRGPIYYAEYNGYVHYLYHPDPNYACKGHGGLIFIIQVADTGTGEVKEVALPGPYKGVVAVANKEGFGPVIDCDIREADSPSYAWMTGAVTLEFAQKALDVYAPDLKLVRHDLERGEFQYVVRPK